MGALTAGLYKGCCWCTELTGPLVSTTEVGLKTWTKEVLGHADHRVDRVLSFFASRQNWDSPNPSPAGECARPLVGAHSLARVPIPTRGHTLWYLLYIYDADYRCVIWHIFLLCILGPSNSFFKGCVPWNISSHKLMNPVRNKAFAWPEQLNLILKNTLSQLTGIIWCLLLFWNLIGFTEWLTLDNAVREHKIFKNKYS